MTTTIYLIGAVLALPVAAYFLWRVLVKGETKNGSLANIETASVAFILFESVILAFVWPAVVIIAGAWAVVMGISWVLAALIRKLASR